MSSEFKPQQPFVPYASGAQEPKTEVKAAAATATPAMESSASKPAEPKLTLPGLDRVSVIGAKVRLNTQLAPDAYLYLTNYMKLADFDHASEALEEVLRWMAEIDPRLKLDPSDPRLKPVRTARAAQPVVKKKGRPKRRSLAEG